ncbi:trigger factor [uncultured Oscillibacter sp.]|uniref:trigger factor n=1 Tax=uncultured Oscillibacter sp. TaxID=876091 RepID=UPI0025F6AF6A|nr:trigger factor [uncultured Oscillibacter sp.]
MSVKSCEKIEKSQVALTIEVGAEAFQAAVEKAYRKMRGKINMPGFRPGKAPRKLIERMYGAEVFYEEAINIAFPDAYEEAVKEQELQVVGYPAVELVGDATGDGFTFKAIVPVYPEVTLGEYKGLTAEKEEVKVSAADVDERLKQLSDRNTRLVSVEREAKEGDTAVIDFDGYLDGKPFDGGKGENHSLELGSHSFVPGFEEQVVGMKAGDEKDIDITFPEDYHADLAGKAVVFKVKCHEVKEKEVPEMDDEFAKDVSEFDTLKELKADLKKKISEERQKAADREFEDALMTKVAEGITAEIPDAMVENQARQFVENFKMQITQQGIPYDQYAQMTGITEAKLLEDAKEPALRQVRMDLALAAVIKAENIEASDEEVEDEFKKLAEQYGMDLEMVKKYVQADQVKDQVISRKAVAVVVDSATAVKPEKKTAKKAAKKAEDKDEAAEGEEKPKKAAKKTAKKAAEGEEKAAKKAADDEEKPVKKSTKKAAKEAKKEEE